MLYPSEIYEVFSWFPTEALSCKNLHKWSEKVYMPLITSRNKNKHPDWVLRLYVPVEIKDNKYSGYIFNDTPPNSDCYYVFRNRSKRSIIIINGSHFEYKQSEEEIIKNGSHVKHKQSRKEMFKQVLHQLHNATGTEHVADSQTIDLIADGCEKKKSITIGCLTFWLRFFSRTSITKLFRMISKNTISLFVPTNDNEINNDISFMAANLGIEESCIESSKNYYDDSRLLIYSRGI